MTDATQDTATDATTGTWMGSPEMDRLAEESQAATAAGPSMDAVRAKIAQEAGRLARLRDDFVQCLGALGFEAVQFGPNALRVIAAFPTAEAACEAMASEIALAQAQKAQGLMIDGVPVRGPNGENGARLTAQALYRRAEPSVDAQS